MDRWVAANLASIPKCNPGLGSMPLDDAGDMLQRLVASCAAEPSRLIWHGETPCPMTFDGRVENVALFDRPAWTGDDDLLVVMTLPLAYQPSWGCYDGLPGQYSSHFAAGNPAGAATRFVEQCMQGYENAMRHVHLGMDERGECYLSLPRRFVTGHGRPGDPQLAISDIVADDGGNGPLEVFTSGPFLAYRLSSGLRLRFECEGYRFSPGQSCTIGSDLRHLPLSFCSPAPGEAGSSYADILLPVLPEIVVSETPRLTATCYLLDYSFRLLAQAVESAAGQGRRVVGLAAVLLDKRGFQSRGEQFFVPWRAVVPVGEGSGNIGVKDLGQVELFCHLSELSCVAA